MCQSIAEGGKRCQGHLKARTSAAMATYVVHKTGLPRAEVGPVITALRREFADAPAPTRAEVDEFLEKQAAEVEHERELSDDRRDSIVDRLRAGIGQVLPDGATFAAWKNLMDRAWDRVKGPVKAVLVGAAAVGLLAGAADFFHAQGQYLDAYHGAKEDNVAMAIHDKYGDTVTGDPTPYGRWSYEYTVNGHRAVCQRDYDLADNTTVKDITLTCENDSGDMVEVPASGTVDVSRQTPYTHTASEYDYWDAPVID